MGYANVESKNRFPLSHSLGCCWMNMISMRKLGAGHSKLEMVIQLRFPGF